VTSKQKPGRCLVTESASPTTVYQEAVTPKQVVQGQCPDRRNGIVCQHGALVRHQTSDAINRVEQPHLQELDNYTRQRIGPRTENIDVDIGAGDFPPTRHQIIYDVAGRSPSLSNLKTAGCRHPQVPPEFETSGLPAPGGSVKIGGVRGILSEAEISRLQDSGRKPAIVLHDIQHSISSYMQGWRDIDTGAVYGCLLQVRYFGRRGSPLAPIGRIRACHGLSA
jgi:hypothetical protein